MAKRRDLQAVGEGDGLDGVGVFAVYKLGEDQTARGPICDQDELLLGEGIDPTWVPSTAAERAEAEALSAEKTSSWRRRFALLKAADRPATVPAASRDSSGGPAVSSYRRKMSRAIKTAMSSSSVAID